MVSEDRTLVVMPMWPALTRTPAGQLDSLCMRGLCHAGTPAWQPEVLCPRCMRALPGLHSVRLARRHSSWHSSAQLACSLRRWLACLLASVPARGTMTHTPAWQPSVESSAHARPRSCVHVEVASSVHAHAPRLSLWTPGASAQLLGQLRSARPLASPRPVSIALGRSRVAA